MTSDESAEWYEHRYERDKVSMERSAQRYSPIGEHLKR